MKWIPLTIMVVSIVLVAHGLLYQNQSVLIPSGNQTQIYTIKGEHIGVVMFASNASNGSVILNDKLYNVSVNKPLYIYLNRTGVTSISIIKYNQTYLIEATIFPNNAVRWEYIISGIVPGGVALALFLKTLTRNHAKFRE